MKKIILAASLLLCGCGDADGGGEPNSCSSNSCTGDNICINARCEFVYDVNYDVKVETLTINDLNYWSGETFEVIMTVVYGNTQNSSMPCSTRVPSRLSERGEFSGDNFEDYYGERISRDGCRLEGLRDGDSLYVTVRNLAFFEWVVFTCEHDLSPNNLKNRRLICTGGDEGALSLIVTPQSVNITNN